MSPGVLLAAAALVTGGGEIVERGIVEGFPVDVAVSSVLSREGRARARYRPANVIDDEHATVWSHDGAGTGEWVELRFPGAVRMLGIEIYPGDAAGNAIDGFEVRVDDEPVRAGGYDTLAAVSRWVYFVPFGGMRNAERVRMTVQKTYRGADGEGGCVGTFRPLFAELGGAPAGRSPLASALRFAAADDAHLEQHLADGEVALTHEHALEDGTLLSASEVKAPAHALATDGRWEAVVGVAQRLLRLALAGRELVSVAELGDKTRIVSVTVDDRGLGRERVTLQYELGGGGWLIRRVTRTELR